MGTLIKLSDKLKENYQFYTAGSSPFYDRTYDLINPCYVSKQWGYGNQVGNATTPPLSNVGRKNALDMMWNLGRELRMYMNNRVGTGEDIENISDIIIMRVVKRESDGFIDVYISFKQYDIEYWGVFKSFNTPKPVFDCELLHDRKVFLKQGYDKQLQGYISKRIYEWFKPEEGTYQALEPILCRDWMGKMYDIRKNATFNLKSVDNWWTNNPSVLIDIAATELKIVSPEYYFLNNWLKKLAS